MWVCLAAPPNEQYAHLPKFHPPFMVCESSSQMMCCEMITRKNTSELKKNGNTYHHFEKYSRGIFVVIFNQFS